VNRTLAQVLSVLFHPLLVPTYLFCIVLYVLPPSVLTFPVERRWAILVLVFCSTFLIPGLGTYFMYRHGYVGDLTLEHRPERNLPFFFTSVCFGITAYLFYQEAYFDRLFFYIMALITLSVFLTFLFSFWWKISAHAVGLGGALGILFLLNKLMPENQLLYIIVAAIILTGLVLSARLALEAHSPVEVYSGFLLGFSLSFGMLMAAG
jgi:membrane-associated phospholipid phosphatase